MPPWIWITITAIALILLAGLFYVIASNKKLQHGRVDGNVNNVTAKHPILANPIILTYVLFPVAIIIVVAYFYRYYE